MCGHETPLSPYESRAIDRINLAVSNAATHAGTLYGVFIIILCSKGLKERLDLKKPIRV